MVMRCCGFLVTRRHWVLTALKNRWCSGNVYVFLEKLEIVFHLAFLTGPVLTGATVYKTAISDLKFDRLSNSVCIYGGDFPAALSAVYTVMPVDGNK